MTQAGRGIVTLLAAALLAAVGFGVARYWEAAQGRYARVEVPQAPCDLRMGPCRIGVDGGEVAFSIAPASIPLMQPLRLSVETRGLAPSAVEVDVRGLNMSMGLNRTRLERTGDGRWEGETILPICSQRRMEWEAAVRLDAERRVEVPFPFHTRRP